MLVASCVLCGMAKADILLQPGFDQAFVGDVQGRTRAWGIGVADFNGDGIDDIVSGDTYGDVHLLTGNGDGTFADQGVVINAAFYDAFGLAAADFNGDGNQDFVLCRTGGSAVIPEEGQVLLYLGNGDGTFQATGFPQLGLLVGVAGTDPMVLAAGDVDGDMDIDLAAGDITASDNAAADVTLFRNMGNDAMDHPLWAAETVISAPNVAPDPEQPPYFPPTSYLSAYGLAFGDVDGDNFQDLLVGDRASYLYIYRNDGTGSFAPVRYDVIGTRPFALTRIHETFTSQLAVAAGDLNGDGMVDFVTGGTDGLWDGQVDLWLNTGNDASGRPRFMNAGIIGGAGTDARGLALGQLNPAIDAYRDVVFGNYEGDLNGLFADLTDTDGDGIVDRFDNAPLYPNAPRLDMNTDGGINRLDQLDNDNDGIGDPADDDDDNDGVLDDTDNCPYTPNTGQADFDADGRGDACDPLNDTDSDSDGVPDGPIDPDLFDRAMDAKARWSLSDTHFVVRIDALGRVFQNEFTQTMADAAVLTPAEWEVKKFDNYNGIGDEPALSGYQVPADLPGGKEVPLTLVVISRLIWDAFGDPDPVQWINDRLASPYLEIGQHGTYHANNTMLGDWANDPSINFYSCEMCGFTVPEMFQLMRIGRRTLLGDYAPDQWLLQSGAMPGVSPAIDFTTAANPLISFAPPFDTSDPAGRDAVSRLGHVSFSASLFEEQSPVFTPEGSHHEQFDQFGMFHASADLEVDPVSPDGMTFEEYLVSITQFGGLNTWLIEEVEWSTRYCNDLPRLVPCPDAPEGVNRENNMVDPDRWDMWMTLLDYVKAAGQPMTLGDVGLAMAFDNAPTVPNPDQGDANHNGIGDAIDGAVLAAEDVVLGCAPGAATGDLLARLTADAGPIPGQEILFEIDSDGDGTEESYFGMTDADGWAAATVTSPLALGTVIPYSASWDGVLLTASDTAEATVSDVTPPTITEASVDPDKLWPPNRRMREVVVTVEATDVCSDEVTCIIDEITSNEPEQADPGDLAPDWMITGPLTADLRAERLGDGDGRIYTITVECVDESGNAASKDVLVTVDHDLRGDFDNDGDVDLDDFALFAVCYGGPGYPPGPDCPSGIDADLDGDGDVDLLDFMIFATNFTGAP
jgi:hypothetical protein